MSADSPAPDITVASLFHDWCRERIADPVNVERLCHIERGMIFARAKGNLEIGHKLTVLRELLQDGEHSDRSELLMLESIRYDLAGC